MKSRSKLVWLVAMFAWAGLGASAQVLPSDNDPLQTGEHMVELNGVKLWYKVAGTGPVCVMPTPAWGIGSDLYFRTLQSMERLFTVVYLDSRGTGRSGPGAAPTDHTWGHLVGDLEALRKHLKQERWWMMGHSEGGMQVLHYVCDHPERVEGMVLLEAAAAWDDAQQRDLRMRIKQRKGQPLFDSAVKAMEEGPKPGQRLTDYLKSIIPLYWSDPKAAEPFSAVIDELTASDEAMAARGASKRFPFDLRDRLRTVNAPALIVVGDDDFICSVEAARRLHLALPNSKLLVIEHSGHFPWMEQPAAFEAHVTEFLAAIGLRTR
jgi:proline iminopeptidase